MSRDGVGNQGILFEDRREGPFMLDPQLMKYIDKLSSEAFKILIFMAFVEDQGIEDFDFARDCGLSGPAVLAACAELKRAGLLVIEQKEKSTVYGVTTRAEREAFHAA